MHGRIRLRWTRRGGHLLAARGAQVVVNDLGGTQEGEGADGGPPRQVAVVDETGYTVPAHLGDFVGAFMSHLRPATGAAG